MADRHAVWRSDLALRAIGLGAAAFCALAITHVLRLHEADPARWTPGLVAYLWMAAGFLCGSAGAAMMAWGSHLFDRVVTSERWRTQPSASVRPAIQAAAHQPDRGIAPEAIIASATILSQSPR